MSKVFWAILAENGRAAELEKLSPPLQQRLRSLSEDLDLILRTSDAATRTDILAKLCTEVIDHLPELQAADEASSNIPEVREPSLPETQDYRSEEIPPEILEWARQQLNEEVIVAGLREIRETGGLELADFLHELEREATPHE
jgi:hypothetical protein